jgi:quercetin dioxygenase-like cupin family protein
MHRGPIAWVAGAACGAALAWCAAAAEAQGRPSQSRTAFTGTLPVLDGTHLQASLLEVTYEPGGANPPHRHPCPVVGYVLEGAIRLQLEKQDIRIVKAGETFYESPDDVHLVSANASADAPARFLAYFVCDRATPLSVPVTDREEKP